jgi:hypothetical protein
VAVVAAAAAATRPGALMAAPTPGVVAEQPGPEGPSLAAVHLVVAEPEQPVPRTEAAEPAVAVAVAAAVGK